MSDPLRVYVAGASRELDRAEAAIEYLRHHDVVITVDWPAQIRARIAAGTLVPEADMDDDEAYAIAIEDLEVGVGTADVLLLLAAGEDVSTRGAWVELGYAKALRLHGNMPEILVAGPTARQSIFCRIADAIYSDDSAALGSIVAGAPMRGPGFVVPAEKVAHPAHYGGRDNPYETIKVLEAWFPEQAMSGFNLGNAIKYLSRAGKKGGESLLTDLRKAAWYLDRTIEQISKKEGV